ncbi:hypothetical protein EMA8858_01214 [Emticicia aquatica]|uniref:Uncharacterized protein n=1 Tax=Emticicia aquatica TaxID=1681835 RepID=A0ABM9AMU6_9BACT|nr:YfhO family protein [Emticicia aquatica]CAH0995094.1 hypothetical protein EMA8858_01214 [Emticicia aquatica]
MSQHKKLKGLNQIKSIENSAVFDVQFTQKVTNELRKESLQNLKVLDNQVSGQIKLLKPKILFFSIPYDRGWSATINGRKMEILKIDIGLTGILLETGINNVNLVYETPYLIWGI